MNLAGLLNSFHRTLARSRLVIRLAILLRNQCRCIIKYHLSEEADIAKNGELWFAQLIAQNSSIFIDVGANIGNWANLFLVSMLGSGKGLLFDPSEYAIEKLNQRFGQAADIEVIQLAVADMPGKMTFFEEPDAGETSSLVPEFSNLSAIKKWVNVTTLDIEVEKRQLKHIDFLKIDAEGYDFHVLRGASGLLSQQQIGVIQFEYGKAWAIAGSTLAAALNFLKSFGYQVFLLKSTGLFEINYSLYGEYFEYSNFVAVSPNKIMNVKPFIRG
jgi:FkbM family methyltransferase